MVVDYRHILLSVVGTVEFISFAVLIIDSICNSWIFQWTGSERKIFSYIPNISSDKNHSKCADYGTNE